MKKLVKPLLFISLCWLLCLPVSAQRKAVSLKEGEDSKAAFLYGWVEKHERLPRNLLQYKQITLLNLAPAVKHVMYQDPRICLPVPNESKLRKFPSWIRKFEQLEEVNLKFNPSFPYVKELPKLHSLPRLKKLSIEPTEISDELIAVLAKFPHLKELHICTKEIDEQQLNRLKTKLPGTVIN